MVAAVCRKTWGADRRETGPTAGGDDLTVEVPGVDEGPDRAWEHEVVVPPGPTDELAVSVLALPVPDQLVHAPSRQGDDPAASALGWADVEPIEPLHSLHLAHDLQPVTLQVDGRPLQRQR